jgi:hypothetical protein
VADDETRHESGKERRKHIMNDGINEINQYTHKYKSKQQ